MARITGIFTPSGINYVTNMRSLSLKDIPGKASFLKGNGWVVVICPLMKPEGKLEQQQNKDERYLLVQGENLAVHLFFVGRICAG